MSRVSPGITLTPEERGELSKIIRSHRSEQRMVKRAQVVLAAAEGLQNREIARQLALSQKAVGKWRSRFARDGMPGLLDKPRPGSPRTYAHEERLAVVRAACRKPPVESQWSVRDLQQYLAQEFGLEMSHMTVHRILSSLDLKPHQCQSWLESCDPEFEAKQAQIVGLYLNPPTDALVICMDEKTSMQALGRPEPNKPLRPGQPEKMDAHYIRHGTQSLLAALVVHEGKVKGECYDRHGSEQFIDFLETLESEFPDRELYIILDNLSVHKSKPVKEWHEPRAHRIHFIFTPTRASWLNQIEIWFSILTRKVLKRGVFNSKAELIRAIMSFIDKYNLEAKPFAWTYRGDPLRL